MAKYGLMAGTLDRLSPVPLHFQLSELLEYEIASGRSTSGRLPSEPDLCDQFGVSRSTVRQALARLEQEGVISRRKGVGTFVNETKQRSWLLQSADGFFQEEAERMGRFVTSVVLRAERAPLPRWAADALSLPARTVGVTLERVRSVDGLVAMYNINHLLERYANTVLSLTDPSESLYQRLRERDGVAVANARRVVEAVPAEERLAELLEVPPHTPLVFIRSVSWDRNLEAFDCYQSWLRTDRMKIDIQVTSATAPVAPGH
jgi:GntR family transcriptional regulator